MRDFADAPLLCSQMGDLFMKKILAIQKMLC